MPAKNRKKIYVKDGYYHVYNRGVAKQEIFKDEQDYRVFLSYIKFALSSVDSADVCKVNFDLRGRSFQAIPRLPKNFLGELELVAYCLMPNHFHLLIKQLTVDSMRSFTSSLCTRYSMYFNKKYDRVGPLFQGRYKAVMVNTDKQLLHLSRYIHLNPSAIADDLTAWYSSYSVYLERTKSNWLKPDIVLKFFNSKVSHEFEKASSYEEFVEKTMKENEVVLEKLIID